jgi:hypothetical protein
MPLDAARYINPRTLGDGSVESGCPACAEAGGDHHHRHLRVWPDGKFACAARPGDREHRSRIWNLIGDHASARRPPPAVLMRQTVEARWRAQARHRRSRVLERPWTAAQIEGSSPTAPPPEPLAACQAVLRLFPAQDTLWIGELRESGSWRNARRFRTAAEWLRSGIVPGPRIVPSSFRPGSLSRNLASMVRRRFLVIESDTLSVPEQGAVLRWCADPQGGKLRLRAIIHTGGRSLHGWFDAPPAGAQSRLQWIVTEWGADPALFCPVQPVRLPGWPREDTGRMPALIYLNPDPNP